MWSAKRNNDSHKIVQITNGFEIFVRLARFFALHIGAVIAWRFTEFLSKNYLLKSTHQVFV